MIDSHSFGKMIIDGRQFRSDLIIFPNHQIAENWHRHAGHLLIYEDISDLVAEGPEYILVGTGVGGMMRVDRELEGLLQELKINLISARNAKAVKKYNELHQGHQIGACFHLTC
ncbi:MAG: hypothetical protein HKM93_21885 [Desulfobacteraceae bacterium]|nr:hypothetical protein [Desulfobacteraceae bacterium]